MVFRHIFATSVGHRAYVNNKQGMGYFTEALIDGLRGNAATTDGNVTVASLLQYIEAQVPKAVRRDLPGKDQQTPYPIITGYANELVLSHSDSLKAPERLPGNSASIENGPVVEICQIGVEARHEMKAGKTKRDQCPPIHLDLLDTSYRQSAFPSSGGNGTTTMTLSDIPAGIELSVIPSGSYSVSEPKLIGDRFSLTVSCTPPDTFWHYGCKNKVTVKAHYLLHPKVVPVISRPPFNPSPTEPVGYRLAEQLDTIAKTLISTPYSTTTQRNGVIGHGFRTECSYEFPPQCGTRIAEINKYEVEFYVSYRVQIQQLRTQALALLHFPGQESIEDDKKFTALDKAAVEPMPIPKNQSESVMPPRKYLAVAAYLQELANQLRKLPN